MVAVENRVGKGNILARAMHEEKGHILTMHELTQSALFSALQISTSFVSLLILGYIGTAVFTMLLCGYFWTHIVRRIVPQIVTFVSIVSLHIFLFDMAATTLRRGKKEVAKPGWWLFYYTLLTSLTMVLGIFLAGIRLILLMLLSILDLSRVDRSLLPYFKRLDKGYMGFYGMLVL